MPCVQKSSTVLLTQKALLKPLALVGVIESSFTD